MVVSGEKMVAGKDDGGNRDFLQGKPVHAGDQLQVWIAGHWLDVRYEIGHDDIVNERYGLLYAHQFDPTCDGETRIEINYDVMWLRWPSRDRFERSSIDAAMTATEISMTLAHYLREIRKVVVANKNSDQTEVLQDALEEINSQIARALDRKY